jgi:hypothetical protein
VEQEEMTIARELLGKHAPAAMGTHATIDKLLEVFSVQLVLRLYNEGQQDKLGSGEMAAIQQGRGH